ncbi:MAG: MMPL family transporter [Coriobacteriales bacterium]|jgi:predicted RND superfamily exporter protein
MARQGSRAGSLKRRLFGAVVRHRRAVIAVFVALTVLGAVGRQMVDVDYDMNDYLPSDAASTQALDVMEEQFSSGIPNARVMVAVSSVAQGEQVKGQIEAIDGVEGVTWLDDVVDVDEPLEVQDQDTVERYYKDGQALYSVVISDEKAVSAVTQIRELIGDGGAMTGSAVSTAVATETTTSQVKVITLLAVLVIVAVLALTTTSWVEPLLVLLALGAAVMINGGSNLMFGTISFVTNAAGTVLQVGISLDFCVFLLHRYEECRAQAGLAGRDAGEGLAVARDAGAAEAGGARGGRGALGPVEECMVDALSKASTAIFSSALTITLGFLALTVMSFRIGPDLGYALAKGMLVSLVTVFTFMPALYVAADGAIRRTAHRRLVPDMHRFGGFVGHVMIPAAVLLALVVVPAYRASESDDISYLYGSAHIFGASTQVGQDTERVEETFGRSDTYALLVPNDDVARERQLCEELEGVDGVTGIIGYATSVGTALPSGVVPADTLAKLRSQDYDRIVISVDADYEGDETLALVGRIRTIAQDCFPDEWLLAGQGVSTTDLMDAVMQDKGRVDALAIAAVLVVLLFALRSASLPFILVLTIEASIWINFSIPYFTGSSEFYVAYLICSTIQLGVSVDYAILLADRYKELRREMLPREAVRQTIAYVTVPVMTSGTVLAACGFLMAALSTHGVLAQLGFFLGRGVLISLAAVLLALPGYLFLLDGVVAHTTVGARFLPRPRRAGR